MLLPYGPTAGRLRRVLAVLGLVVCLGLAAATDAQDTGYKLVVHPDNPIAALSGEQVSRIFLKKVRKWSDGTQAFPVDLTEKSVLREVFSKAIHGRHVAAVKSYWQQMIFSGRAAPPPEVEGEVEVIAWVKANRGAIGYVGAATPTPGVKVVAVGEP
jgi:ABC-type phosphate transport system substrate-binding protein